MSPKHAAKASPKSSRPFVLNEAEAKEQAGTIFDTTEPGVYKVDIRRIMENGEDVYHGTVSPPMATEQFVAEKFGGGTYRFKLHKKEDNGGWTIKKFHTFTLPGSYIPVTGSLPTLINPTGAIGRTPPVGSESNAVGAHAKPGEPIDMMRMMENAAISKYFDMLAQTGQQRGPDLAAIMGPLVGLATTLITTMMNRPPDPMLMHLLNERRNVPSGHPAHPIPTSEIAKAMHELEELKKMFAGRGGNDSDPDAPFLHTMEKFLEVILQQSGGSAALSPSQVPPAGQVLLPPSPATESFPLMTWQSVLRDNRFLIIGAVGRGMPAAQAADVLYNFLDEPGFQSVAELVDQANATDQVLGVLPELGAQREWIDQFVAHLKQEINAPNDDEPET